MIITITFFFFVLPIIVSNSSTDLPPSFNYSSDSLVVQTFPLPIIVVLVVQTFFQFSSDRSTDLPSSNYTLYSDSSTDFPSIPYRQSDSVWIGPRILLYFLGTCSGDSMNHFTGLYILLFARPMRKVKWVLLRAWVVALPHTGPECPIWETVFLPREEKAR